MTLRAVKTSQNSQLQNKPQRPRCNIYLEEGERRIRILLVGTICTATLVKFPQGAILVGLGGLKLMTRGLSALWGDLTL